MKKSIQMSLVCGLVGLITGLFVSLNATGKDYTLFPLFSVLSSVIVSFSIWNKIVIQRDIHSIGFGIFIGVIIVILSHYLTWYLMSLYLYLCNELTGKCLSSLGEKTMNPLESIYLVLPLTLFSLIIAWITLPLGAFLGGIMIKLQNNSRS